MAETMTGNVMRCDIADYLNTGTAETPVYSLMGAGFNSLDENPNAQKDEKTYINQKSQSSSIKSYKTTFAFDSDLIKDEAATMALYDVGRNHRTGGDAEKDYVRVELFKPVTTEGVSNTFEARKFKVAVEVSGIAGGGGEAVKVSGNLNGVGDFVPGAFDTVTKTFTPTA